MSAAGADQTVDIAIVGGGLAGASLAVALAEAPLRLALIESAAPPAGQPAWDERCIALNDASRRIFEACGVWQALRGAAAPILATHISEQGRFGTARFAAADAGLEALGYNVPLRAIGAALLARLRAMPRLRLLQPARVEALDCAGDTVRLSVRTAGTVQVLAARLVAAADGADSSVRRLLGIGAERRDYGQQAIVSAVRLARPHRGVAYERFTPQGPVALIPKPGDTASLVWSVPQEQAARLLALDDAGYLAAVQQAFGGRLGNFLALGRRWAFPLARVMSERLVAPRVVLVGNAAQSLHPVAAQGFNLGLRDVAALAAQVSGAADPGDSGLLSAYESSRLHDRGRAGGLTDLMVRAFSNRVPGLAQGRHWGLVAVDLLSPLRESVLRQHLGHFGLPGGVAGYSAKVSS
ncbi:MAG: 2-octaprenyl-6-methoxyphenyl hydroxylase [Nevskia sp.]|nr:2-octaprenyl-6-methoxyphenyl hydroxylase [Nevskia sp.]